MILIKLTHMFQCFKSLMYMYVAVDVAVDEHWSCSRELLTPL